MRRPDYFEESANYCSIIEPGSYEEATKCEDSSKWQTATKHEIDSLKSTNTWTLVKLPKNARVVDNKWGFRIKPDTEGNSIRYKARLVAHGFTQEKSVDYKETFSPVVGYDSIRIVTIDGRIINRALVKLKDLFL